MSFEVSREAELLWRECYRKRPEVLKDIVGIYKREFVPINTLAARYRVSAGSISRRYRQIMSLLKLDVEEILRSTK